MPIKELRKVVLLQLEDTDVDVDKKSFKKAVQSLEKGKKLNLSEEGVCKLKKSEMMTTMGKNKVCTCVCVCVCVYSILPYRYAYNFMLWFICRKIRSVS